MPNSCVCGPKSALGLSIKCPSRTSFRTIAEVLAGGQIGPRIGFGFHSAGLSVGCFGSSVGKCLQMLEWDFTRQDCRSVGGPGLSQKCLVEVFDRLGLQLAVKCWSGISLGLVPAVELIGNQSGFCFQFPSDWSRQWIGFGLNTGLTAPETSRARVN